MRSRGVCGVVVWLIDGRAVEWLEESEEEGVLMESVERSSV